MAKYPSAADVAEAFLLYKLGLMLEDSTFAELAKQKGLAREFLDGADLSFLASLDIKWSDQAMHNGILLILGDYLPAITDAGLELRHTLTYGEHHVNLEHIE
jgi:hypothetical protein